MGSTLLHAVYGLGHLRYVVSSLKCICATNFANEPRLLSANGVLARKSAVPHSGSAVAHGSSCLSGYLSGDRDGLA